MRAGDSPSTLFAPLPTIESGFACLACDAPLHFRTRSAKGQGRAPSRHYRTYSVAEIMTLPVGDIVGRDAWLFLWWPDPHLLAVHEVMSAWGFEFSGKAFTWLKTIPSLARGPRLISTDAIESVLNMGGGFTTRKNSESVWLGRRGKPRILSKGVTKSSSRHDANILANPMNFIAAPRNSALARGSTCSAVRAAKAGRSTATNRRCSMRRSTPLPSCPKPRGLRRSRPAPGGSRQCANGDDT
jgi:N6-adenosine-specific RNA methylase IME4